MLIDVDMYIKIPKLNFFFLLLPCVLQQEFVSSNFILIEFNIRILINLKCHSKSDLPNSMNCKKFFNSIKSHYKILVLSIYINLFILILLLWGILMWAPIVERLLTFHRSYSINCYPIINWSYWHRLKYVHCTANKDKTLYVRIIPNISFMIHLYVCLCVCPSEFDYNLCGV